ncbi:hypothetical protein N7474_003419 [Penicillium riverlandense]|uniref:uncharacterized protein n=1 Tax=Penicillium riverlandense TaxID=1903569 RepID=UPI002548319D|nr:uncharacterized protein N7474_003419 [Penicillium riverlandense]KAJ5826281.1 hypothetical protein N7474_003419 [Penicillium riverlandense]
MSRTSGPVPLPNDPSQARDYEGTFTQNRYSRSHAMMQATNSNIQHKVAKLQVNSLRLKRELFLLHRHIKAFHHPLLETWEADMLTRLIEVVCTRQCLRLPGGISVGDALFVERDLLSRAYSIAARRIRIDALWSLGLSDKYHEALKRYEEVAVYRSPNPFQTEAPFARWLVTEKEKRPQVYEFWSKFFPVCCGRTVEQSSAL